MPEPSPFLHVQITRLRDGALLVDEMVDVVTVSDPDALVLRHRGIADEAADQGDTVQIDVVDPDGAMPALRFLYGPER